MSNLKCHLDLDGVLAKCHWGALDFLGVKIDEWPMWLDTMNIVNNNLPGSNYVCQRAFWDAFGEDFWAGLEPYEWNSELIGLVSGLFEQENIYVTTRPTRNPRCRSGKMYWCQKHLPAWLSRKVNMVEDKFLLANERSMLIDDSEYNCVNFAKKRGAAVCIGRRWGGFEEQTWPEVRERIIKLHNTVREAVDL